MYKILITGASGFIGKHLIPKIIAAEYEVIEVSHKDGDIANKTTWDKFPKSDLVIHLAGRSFVPASWDEPSEFIKCNFLGTLEALNYCRKYNTKLIFLSSYLYGNPAVLPISEEAPLSTPNPYAFSKKIGEDVCKLFAQNFNIDITIFRPFNVYGPGQPEYFLIPSIMKQIKNGEAIKVKDLEPKRDYIYIDDLVTAILAAVNKCKGFQIYNIGSGTSYSVNELINLIQNIMGSNFEVVSELERRKDEIMDTIADINLANNELGWFPQWKLAQGLFEMKEKI